MGPLGEPWATSVRGITCDCDRSKFTVAVFVKGATSESGRKLLHTRIEWSRERTKRARRSSTLRVVCTADSSRTFLPSLFFLVTIRLFLSSCTCVLSGARVFLVPQLPLLLYDLYARIRRVIETRLEMSPECIMRLIVTLDGGWNSSATWCIVLKTKRYSVVFRIEKHSKTFHTK